MKRVLALMLSLLMMIMCSCGEDGTTSQNESSKITSSVKDDVSSSNTSSNASSQASGNSNQQSGGSLEEQTEGEYTINSSLKGVREDANEVFPPENSAQLLNNLTGYADKEAEALRQEILNTGNTEEYYDIEGTIYYVSPGGSDDNDGLSPETPIRTVGRITTLPLKSGDAVLFERNSIFRQTNHITCNINNVTYGSYGEGRKPMIFASAKNYADPGLWQPTKKKNVWVTETGYIEVYNAVFDHGKEIGYLKQNGLDQLQKNLDYYCNPTDGLTYLYYDKGNPGKFYEDIELCLYIYNFYVGKHVHGVTVDNLCLKYSTMGAVVGAFGNNDLTVTNCEVGYSGGCTTGAGNRMGNGIGTWAGNKNLTMSHNWVYQSYDSGISPQSTYGSKWGIRYDNTVFCNNLLEYNNADFEWFDAEGCVWDGLKCDGNIMRFTSLGWGTRLEDAGIRGIEGCIKAETPGQIFSNFSFKNNIIDCPGKEIVNWPGDEESVFEKMDIRDNTVYVKASYREKFTGNHRSVMRGIFCPDGIDRLFADSLAELEAAWKTFDKSETSKVFWYD